MLQPNTLFIVIFSPSKSTELFYLCKVIDFGVAPENVTDKYQHNVPQGSSFIKCQYLEKMFEKSKSVKYKLLPDFVFIYPAEVMSPMVPLKEDLSLSTSEYQWLSDMI